MNAARLPVTSKEAEERQLHALAIRVRHMPNRGPKEPIGGHDLHALRQSARKGDLIAREWLRRLGVVV